jgi:phosphatidylinositol-4-phosphate 5-kinase
MQIRARFISSSIISAISSDDDPAKNGSRLRRILRTIIAFFAFFKLSLARYRPQDFKDLRKNVWHLDEDEYTTSFSPNTPQSNDADENAPNTPHGKGKEVQLKPAGDLGYSGSTFFTTANAKYLIKSLPRRFEHQFFTHDLLEPYIARMKADPRSLLVRIADMVYTPRASLGGIIGTAPTHHIIMENLLYGKDDGREGDWGGMKWETYDLKPSNYFFPERDIAEGRLAPDSVIDKLVDDFPDRVKVKPEDKKRLLEILEADTRLLADNNAIDYSLFLVRYPGPNARDAAHAAVPAVKSESDPWRTGIDDVEGKWTYRVVVLDFFWARHKFRAKLMTGLVKTFNKMAHKGPMSITANPNEYRDRFLSMVKTLVAES